MKNKLCPKCSSQEIVPNIEIRDYDASSYRPLSLTVDLPRPNDTFIYKGSASSEIRAWMCGSCGYTEFYSLKHYEILSAYRQNQT